MFLNSFSDVVCLKLLGREFHTLGPVYLIALLSKGDMDLFLDYIARVVLYLAEIVTPTT